MTPRKPIQSPDLSPGKPMLANKDKAGTHGNYFTTESAWPLTFWEKQDEVKIRDVELSIDISSTAALV